MIGQVQTINGVKQVVPLSNESTTDYVTDNDMRAVTSNAVHDELYQKYKVGTTSSPAYIKIKIKPATSWMLNFTLVVYQGYRAIKIMISGYNYGSGNAYWHNPEAVVLGDSDNGSYVPVYFGYDSKWNLWVAIGGGNYTGFAIVDIANGYTQVDLGDLFDISFVSSLSGTTQATVYATTTAKSVRVGTPSSVQDGDIWIV